MEIIVNPSAKGTDEIDLLCKSAGLKENEINSVLEDENDYTVELSDKEKEEFFIEILLLMTSRLFDKEFRQEEIGKLAEDYDNISEEEMKMISKYPEKDLPQSVRNEIEIDLDNNLFGDSDWESEVIELINNRLENSEVRES